MARKATVEYGAEDVVGAAESAAICGVKTPQISRWEKAGKMPPLLAKLKATSVWLRADVVEKARREGRIE